MKKLAILLSLVLSAVTGFAQAPGSTLDNYSIGGRYQARAYFGTGGPYALYAQGAVPSGSSSVLLYAVPYQGGSGTIPGCFVEVRGKYINPIFVGNTLTVNDANTETVTITAVSGCTATATFSNAHNANARFTSGSFGLYESIADAKSTGGLVTIDSKWGGSSANITAGTVGSTTVALEDIRSGSPSYYGWNGTNYVSTGNNFSYSVNASNWTYFVNSELLTLATGATTTDTTANLLPALSVIDMVQGVVNTTITSACTGWELGDPTTAARFTANDTTLTAGEAKAGVVAMTTGVASATTGIYQAAAAKVRVTCAGGNPGAGKVRIVVYGRTFTLPTL